MATTALRVETKAKWWSRPLLIVLRGLVCVGVIRSEKYVSCCANFIADHGFKFKVGK